MSKLGGTTSLHVVRMMSRVAKDAGGDISDLLREAGIDPETVHTSDSRYPAEVIDELWGKVAARLKDPALGLHAAERMSETEFALMDYALRNTATLGELLVRIARYTRIHHSTLQMDLLERDGQFAYVRSTPAGMSWASQDIEAGFAAVFLRGRAWTGVEWKPLEVRFRHPAPPDLSVHETFFGCPVKFGHEENALLLAPETVALPLKDADPQLAALLSAQLEALVANLPPVGQLAERVRSAIVSHLPKGEPGLPEVSQSMGMSSRTLQRRLAEACLTFGGLLDDTRRELAIHYVQDPARTLDEVSFLLGYSERSTFQRAFKRWTGQPPGEFRLAHLTRTGATSTSANPSATTTPAPEGLRVVPHSAAEAAEAVAANDAPPPVVRSLSSN